MFWEKSWFHFLWKPLIILVLGMKLLFWSNFDIRTPPCGPIAPPSQITIMIFREWIRLYFQLKHNLNCSSLFKQHTLPGTRRFFPFDNRKSCKRTLTSQTESYNHVSTACSLKEVFLVMFEPPRHSKFVCRDSVSYMENRRLQLQKTTASIMHQFFEL